MVSPGALKVGCWVIFFGLTLGAPPFVDECVMIFPNLISIRSDAHPVQFLTLDGVELVNTAGTSDHRRAYAQELGPGPVFRHSARRGCGGENP